MRKKSMIGQIQRNASKNIRGALRDFVPLIHFKKRDKHP